MTGFEQLHDGSPSPEFSHNREVADAKREALDDLREQIESAGYSAYVTEFDEHTDEDRLDDTFEVRFVVGLRERSESEGE